MKNRRSDFPYGSLVSVVNPSTIHYRRVGVVFRRPPSFLTPPAQWPISVWFGTDESPIGSFSRWNNFHPDELGLVTKFEETIPCPAS